MSITIFAAQDGSKNGGEGLSLSGNDRLLGDDGKRLTAVPEQDGFYSSKLGAQLLLQQTDTSFSMMVSGAWNSVKSVRLTGSAEDLAGRQITMSNIVHVDVRLSDKDADADVWLNVQGAKRGDIVTDDGHDVITVGVASNGGNWSEEFVVNTRGGNDQITFTPADAGSVRGSMPTIFDGHTSVIKIYGEEGNDRLDVSALKAAVTLSGGEGDDTLLGGEGSNRLHGGDGQDVLVGIAAGDSLYGGDGADSITSSGVNSIVYGQDGDDVILVTGAGSDVRGGDGADQITVEGDCATVRGDAGDDVILVTGHGADVRAGSGNDTVTVQGDYTVLRGDNGLDVLVAQGAYNTVHGGNDADTITATGDGAVVYGNNGDDLLTASGVGAEVRAGSGNDTIVGGAVDQVLYGNGGNDVFVLQDVDMAGSLTIVDFKVGQDTLDLASWGVRYSDLSFTAVTGGVMLALDADFSVMLNKVKLTALDESSFLNLLPETNPGLVIEGSEAIAASIRLLSGSMSDLQVHRDADGTLRYYMDADSRGLLVTDLATPVQTILSSDVDSFQWLDWNGSQQLVIDAGSRGLLVTDGTSPVRTLLSNDVDSFELVSWNGSQQLIIDAGSRGLVMTDGVNPIRTLLSSNVDSFELVNWNGTVQLVTDAGSRGQLMTDGASPVRTLLSSNVDSFELVNWNGSQQLIMDAGSRGLLMTDGVSAARTLLSNNVDSFELATWKGVQTLVVDAGSRGLLLVDGVSPAQTLVNADVQSFKLADLDNDGSSEVIVDFGTTVGLRIYHDDGQVSVLRSADALAYDVLDYNLDGYLDVWGSFADGSFIYPQGPRGADTLVGTVDDDTIRGFSGNDVLTGGAGNDVFEFGAGTGHDIITDFGDGQDVVHLAGIAGFASFADVQAASVLAGSDMVITFDASNSLTLEGVDTLLADYFTFA